MLWQHWAKAERFGLILDIGPVDTHKTLINRYRQTNSDTRSWSEFCDFFWKPIYSVAHKADLFENHAEGGKETFFKLTKKHQNVDF